MPKWLKRLGWRIRIWFQIRSKPKHEFDSYLDIHYRAYYSLPREEYKEYVAEMIAKKSKAHHEDMDGH